MDRSRLAGFVLFTVAAVALPGAVASLLCGYAAPRVHIQNSFTSRISAPARSGHMSACDGAAKSSGAARSPSSMAP